MTGSLFGVAFAFAAATGAPEAPPQEWQQQVHYTIEARLDEETDVLTGRMRIRYRNESPDTLTAFYLHQYLNAFRPNSAWARRDLEHGIRTFQQLGEDDRAFERLTRASVDGEALLWTHPYAPDSTIVRLDLSTPLPPGGTVTVDLDWDARLSTVPRRQGRRGRHYDFAQWYPRVVVYDREGWRDQRLYRQGEFYGEFATYDVRLEVAEDQVLGATGVPLSGDPGWVGARAGGAALGSLQSDWYGSERDPPCAGEGRDRVCGVPGRTPVLGPSLGLLAGDPADGTKQVRWYAEDVHHFAWSADPAFVYEGGERDGTAIHVLYLPEDSESWGDGIAVERTRVALDWLEHVFGPYAYPQVTNLRRLDSGGTEFPMLVMNASASQSLILHEVGHIWAHGILGNNEWYEGWLDEGMSSFQTAWFFEKEGRGREQWLQSELRVLDLELQGKSEPVTFVAQDYSEYAIYSRMIYTKGSLILRMLRDMGGEDKMLEILRTYYERNRFKHVDQEAFQAVAEEVLRTDLDWFFGQWLHATGVVDYSLESVRVQEIGGMWETTVRIARNGEMRMPVPLRFEGDGQVADTTVSGGPFEQTVQIQTRFRPKTVALDPDGEILDWNALNNHWSASWIVNPAVDRRLPHPSNRPSSSRDRKIVDYIPLLWWNDPGGVVLGVQSKGNYMGRYHMSLFRLGLPAIQMGDKGGGTTQFDWGSLYLRLGNPILGSVPRLGHESQFFAGEGRVFASHAYDMDLSALPVSGSRKTLRLFGSLAAVYDSTYLIPGRWTPRENLTVEAGAGYVWRSVRPSGESRLAGEMSLGINTRNYRYTRGTLEILQDWQRRRGFQGRMRGFVGVVMGEDPDPETTAWDGSFVPLERRVFLSGGGPYGSIGNPYLRSAGSVLSEYGDATGGGELRGYYRGITSPVLVGANLEVLSPGLELGPVTLRVGAFADGAWTSENLKGFNREGSPVQPDSDLALLWDAGPSLDLQSEWTSDRLRIDFPVFVSVPALAQSESVNQWAFRIRFQVRAPD
jgi:hypothetical protein